MSITILGIESSCDDTSASVVRDGVMLSNVIASQAVHEAYGGVVPELASRAHQQNIIPVVSEAIKRAGIDKTELDAIAFTRGPGLMGSLLVGTSFAKGFAAALGIPMIEVNHLQAHVLAHFIKESPDDDHAPSFPFLCLLVSGGNSQIIRVKAYNEMEVIGQTIDDAAGEAFDKCAKVMGLGYPGGPVVNRLANEGNPKAFSFSKPHIAGYDYSFSGLKTSFLYTLRDALKENGIGRPSTRAAIIEILFKRHYIRKERKSLIATPTGIELIQTIKNELLKSVELTGQWENKLRRIERGEYEPATFLEELKAMVKEIVVTVLSDNTGSIAVTEATEKPQKRSATHKKNSAVTKPSKNKVQTENASKTDVIYCPLCHTGTVVKGKNAYGCNNWKSGCTFRLPFDTYGDNLTSEEITEIIKKLYKK